MARALLLLTALLLAWWLAGSAVPDGWGLPLVVLLAVMALAAKHLAGQEGGWLGAVALPLVWLVVAKIAEFVLPESAGWQWRSAIGLLVAAGVAWFHAGVKGSGADAQRYGPLLLLAAILAMSAAAAATEADSPGGLIGLAILCAPAAAAILLATEVIALPSATRARLRLYGIAATAAPFAFALLAAGAVLVLQGGGG